MEDELFDAFTPAQLEPYGPVLWVGTDFKLEERTAFSFQLNPFGQLISADVLGVDLECVAASNAKAGAGTIRLPDDFWVG